MFILKLILLILMTIQLNAKIESNCSNILILYDASGEYGWTGKANAILLENLLGHFESNITSKPTEDYIAGEMIQQDIVFYLGTTYLSNLPSDGYMDFFQDIAEHNKTIVWINYNLQHLQTEWMTNSWGDTTFEETTDFTFLWIETDTPYSRVQYKGVELFKGIIPFATPGSDVSSCVPDEKNNSFACSTELALVEQSTIHNKSTVYAWAYSTLDGNNFDSSKEPYIIKGGNFWFVGDLPFSYMCEEDRYLAFADLLHNILDITHKESHKALMRLEDVSAGTENDDLLVISEYMRNKSIPFTVATIPQYEDPYGIYSNENTTMKLSNSDIGVSLKELYDEGLIEIVQHGFTHQLDRLLNPYNGVTADDFEFMIVTDEDDNGIYIYEKPSSNDSGPWAQDRILRGKTILDELDVTAFAWEAPHYMAGPNHYRAIREMYPIQYARLIYYPWENSGVEDASQPNYKYNFIGQYFPYIIKNDIYGYTIIPENLQNIADQPNPGYRILTPEDTIRFAKKLKVVRDGVASFFYHTYLGTADLNEIVTGLEDLGYEFVKASSLINDTPKKNIPIPAIFLLLL